MRTKTPITVKGVAHRSASAGRPAIYGGGNVRWRAVSADGPGDVSTRETTVSISRQELGVLLGAIPVLDLQTDDLELWRAYRKVSEFLLEGKK